MGRFLALFGLDLDFLAILSGFFIGNRNITKNLRAYINIIKHVFASFIQ